MTRSPYWHAMHRGVDAEGGGVADLQTDVMRFMAILAICLVVIFALVQSIPLRPAEPVPAPEPQPAAIPEADPEPEPVATPEPAVPPAPEPVAIEQPAPAPAPIEVAPPPAPAEPDGFTLRFESDLALTRLVARSVVGLYAIGEQRTLRLNVSEARMSFWEASTPNQYHEMDRSTVPAGVVRTLLTTAELDVTTVKWGVTLPAGMQRDLNGYLDSSSGGALVISADGQLRLEQ